MMAKMSKGLSVCADMVILRNDGKFLVVEKESEDGVLPRYELFSTSFFAEGGDSFGGDLEMTVYKFGSLSLLERGPVLQVYLEKNQDLHIIQSFFCDDEKIEVRSEYKSTPWLHIDEIFRGDISPRLHFPISQALGIYAGRLDSL